MRKQVPATSRSSRQPAGPAPAGPAPASHVSVGDDLLRLVVENATDFAVIATDAGGRVNVWNVGAERLLGHAEHEIVGHALDVIFTPEDRAAGRLGREMRRARDEGRAEDERWHLRRDGSRFWGAGLMMPLAAPGAGFVKIVRDRTRERLDGERLRDAERQSRTLIEGVPHLLWRSCNRGNWTWASPQWCGYTGQSQEDSHGLGWLRVVHPDDQAHAVRAWDEAQPNGALDVEFRVWHAAAAHWVWHHTRSLPVREADGGIAEWLGTTTDIQSLKELQGRQETLLAEARHHARALEAEIGQRRLVEAELLYKAFHDDLTRLHNRPHFIGRLEAALERRTRDAGLRCAVLFLDIDRFSLVNDSLGHGAGDTLLVEVGRRLRGCAGPGTTLARLGGDEFALLVEGATTADVTGVAEAILGAIRQPLWLDSQEVFVSCSIGVVEAAAHHRTPESLLRDADIAMYQAKRHGAGRYAVFTESMHDGAVEALRLQTDLRNAVARGEFVLHYQPIRDAASSAIVALEALVRWRHPRRGLVAPDGFIAAAEESGLIREIGRWVLREACAQMVAWRRHFPGLAPTLSVNTSGAELRDPQFAQATRDVLADSGIDPRSVQIEVTESVFLHQPDLAGATLGSLRALGVRVALDDFGTGYSSLSYLDRYPMDAIKIDRSFVAQMPTRPRSVAIVHTIVALGRAMGLDIVAEGVEDEHQLRVLRDTGCAAVQGYLLGRPMPANDMTHLLARESGHSKQG